MLFRSNNPIAFSRFSYIMGLSLNQDLLSLLDESFSIFVYSDNGKPHFGLLLSLKDASSGVESIKKQEASIPSGFSELLYENMAVLKNVTFRSGEYNGAPIRFVNIDAGANYSFDYSVQGKEWYIGTSKDTLRAILDQKKK